MNLEELPILVQNGICPHTGERYNCGRCTLDPTNVRITDRDKPRAIHFNMCITHPIDGRGWNALLKQFNRSERTRVRQIVSWLLNLGAKCVPVGKCDKEHFCFRHGCIGHEIEREESEVKE